MVRRYGRSCRTTVGTDGGASASLARGGHRRHDYAYAEQGQDHECTHVGICRRRWLSIQRLRLYVESRTRRAKVFSEGLSAGSSCRRLRRLQRRGCGQRDHARRMLGAHEAKGNRRGKSSSRNSAGSSRPGAQTLRSRKTSQGSCPNGAARSATGRVGADVGATAKEALGVERAVAAQASHGRSGELCVGPVDGTERVLHRWRGVNRQQRLGTRDEACGSKSKKFLVRWQSARRKNSSDLGQPDKHMPPARHRPATVSHAVADQPIASSAKRTPQLAARPMEKVSGESQAFVVPV